MNGITADILLWRFPASLILAAAFALGIWALEHYYGRSLLCRTLASGKTAVCLLLLTAAMFLIEGIWAAGLHRTWPFILVMLLLAASLEIVTLRRLRERRNASFLLNHAGLFVVLWAGLFGAPDVTEACMLIRTGESSSLAYASTGELVPLPFEVRLDRFTIDCYDDGTTPRQFRSALRLDDHRAEVSVNHPVHYQGYTLYQDGYDTLHGAYTVLLVTRDPWLWVTWCGIAMLAAGSLLLLFRKK